MGSHLSAFVAKELREPTPQEAQELAALEAEDQRKREAERYERDIRRIYLSQPGATEAEWSKEKARILADDRAARTVRERNAAQAQIARSYRSSF